MRLYLSSYRVPTPNDLLTLLDKPAADIRMAIIPNAKDYYADLARNFKIQETKEYFQKLGFRPVIVDLRSCRPDTVQRTFENYDFVWVAGGNTFCLRHAMRFSGFDIVAQELFEKGTVYGGESAGAIVAGPTLRGTEKADEPQFAAEQIYDGLGLVRQIVIPHADNSQLKDGVAPMLKLYKGNPDAVVLKDNQALVIAGENTTLTTAQI